MRKARERGKEEGRNEEEIESERRKTVKEEMEKRNGELIITSRKTKTGEVRRTGYGEKG